MRVPAMAILAIVVLAALPPTARAAADAPRWTIHDFWEYDIETVVEADLVLNGTVRATVSAFGMRTVKGVSMAAFTTVLTGGGSVGGPTDGPAIDGQWSYAGEQWVESVGFKVVRSVLQIDAEGTASPFGFSFQVQNITENAVLSDSWRYPIDVGTAGALVTNTTSTERVHIQYGFVREDSNTSAMYERTVSLDVVNTHEVRAPAGAFSTFEVRVGWPGGETDAWFYAPSVGNNARTESFNATGGKIASSSLRSFRYQAGEPPLFLGLSPAVAAALIGGAVAGAAIGVTLVVFRRRHARRVRDARDDGPRPPGPT